MIETERGYTHRTPALRNALQVCGRTVSLHTAGMSNYKVWARQVHTHSAASKAVPVVEAFSLVGTVSNDKVLIRTYCW